VTDVRSDAVEGVDDMEDLGDLVRSTLAIARTLRAPDGRLDATLDAVVESARTVTGYDAGLALVENGRLTPTATTASAPHDLDVLQAETGEGPCLDAATSQDVVRVDDTAADERWHGFGSRAAAVGVASMLCAPLWVDGAVVGSLSLYSGDPRAFGTVDVHVARVAAALAAAAIADARRGEQLRDAMNRRDLLGQAKGILMERHRLTADQAFALLARTSQNLNRKLTVVATHLVETGELLGRQPD
jgi:GAF domain-containing protein